MCCALMSTEDCIMRPVR